MRSSARTTVGARMQPHEVALDPLLEYAYSGSAPGDAVVTASALAAVGPSVRAGYSITEGFMV